MPQMSKREELVQSLKRCCPGLVKELQAKGDWEKFLQEKLETWGRVFQESVHEGLNSGQASELAWDAILPREREDLPEA